MILDLVLGFFLLLSALISGVALMTGRHHWLPRPRGGSGDVRHRLS